MSNGYVPPRVSVTEYKNLVCLLWSGQVALSPLNGSVVVVPAGVDGLEQVFEPRRRRCQICSPPPATQPTHSWERRTIAPLPSDNVDTLSDVFRRPIQSEFCCWCRVQSQNTTYVFATPAGALSQKLEIECRLDTCDVKRDL